MMSTAELNRFFLVNWLGAISMAAGDYLVVRDGRMVPCSLLVTLVDCMFEGAFD